MIGKTISHYKILEKLGEGGMGVVYKAEDTKLKREVAIKFLPRHIAATKEERERFKIEAQAAAALNHPNIATIYNIEEVDDEMYIVMEYMTTMTSAPCPARYRIISVSPRDAALCSGAYPFASRALMSAPSSSTRYLIVGSHASGTCRCELPAYPVPYP